MEAVNRKLKRWKLLYFIIHRYAEHRFGLESELCHVEGPCLIVSNHVTTWDPLLVAISFPDNPINYVASEHIFRRGFASKLLDWLVSPIARKKGAAGADTVKACLRRLKEGGTVGIFAEGDCTWDGVTHEVFSATGKLARIGGATLITYRLEGGYISLPRWSKKVRHGKMRGHAVGIYSPEELRRMKPEEITALINRDIYENAWERQRLEHVRFIGKNRAEGIEQGFYICPQCGRIGTVRGAGDHIVCDCGYDVLYTEEGFIDPPVPFETLAQWDEWQKEKLLSEVENADGVLFSDKGLTLREIGSGHRQTVIAEGELCQYSDAISCAGVRFELADISSMAMVKSSILLFSTEEHYYELRAEKTCCLRKYLTVWSGRKNKYSSNQNRGVKL